MKLIYAREKVAEPSIFLAGPSPRDNKVKSWRPEAIELLRELKFDGIVFVPELRGGFGDEEQEFDYAEQIHWEWEALNAATVVVFWVPRDLKVFPAFTTNVEFGNLVSSGKCLFGAPSSSPKNNYLIHLAHRYGVETFDDLKSLLLHAVAKAYHPYTTEL